MNAPEWLDKDSAAARLQRSATEFEHLMLCGVVPRPYVTVNGMRWKADQIETLACAWGLASPRVVP